MQYTNKPILNPDGSVPGSYYDADYFEKGAESGKGSYNGNDYSTQLPLCQHWARDTFERWGPFKTYLELGCGRGWAIWGFLALPELGIEPLGIDISTYAVQTALERVRPYLIEHDASDLSFLSDGSADLIFSNDFMEHLTPAQAECCLRECKRVARKRIVHLISIADGADLPDGEVPPDQDQSHVNLKSVGWWAALFGKVFNPDFESPWIVSGLPHGRTIEMDVRRTPYG